MPFLHSNESNNQNEQSPKESEKDNFMSASSSVAPNFIVTAYQTSAAVESRSSLFWDVIWRMLLVIYRRFGTNYRPIRVPGLPTSWQVQTPTLCYILWTQSLIRHSDVWSKTELECKRAIGIVLGRRKRNTATCGFVGCLNRRFIDMYVCKGGASDVK
jgi:hypothetical protein